MAELQNVFSWSKSRDEQFRECQRKYFYDKYLSWGGWDPHSPKDVRLAYVLKNLKNRWAWKGETVHHVIESSLKSLRLGKPMSVDEASTLLTEIMRREFRSSKAKKYFEDPKKNRGLFEHEYEKGVVDSVWKEVHDSSAECLKNFYASELYQELLRDDKQNWLVIEDLEEFQIFGSKIYVKLDFCRKKEGLIEIYDWKTGKENNRDGEDSAQDIQLGTYAIFAMQRWEVPLEKIRTTLFHLGSAHPVPKNVPLTASLIEATKDAISKSIVEMQRLLSDPSRNIPKPKENFQFTQNTRLCNFCNFYKICEKYTNPS